MLLYAIVGCVLLLLLAAWLFVILTDLKLAKRAAIQEEIRQAQQQADATRARLKGLMAISAASRDRGTPGDVA